MSEGGLDLVEVQVALLDKRLRRLGVWLVAGIAMGWVAGAAICGLFAALVLSLAPEIGVVPALLAVSGPIVLALLIAMGVVYYKMSAALREAQKQVADARHRLSELMTSHKEADEHEESEAKPGLASEFVCSVVTHPKLVSSVAFAALSVLGVRRTLSAIRAAAAVASAGAVATRVAESALNLHRNGKHESDPFKTPVDSVRSSV